MASSRKITSEIIVGISIIVAIIALIFGYVYLRDIPVKRNGYTAFIHFNDITGLETGDPVTVAGLKIGRVQEMELRPGYVQVRVWLNGDIELGRDSQASVKSIGMIGEKYIDVHPGKSRTLLAEGDTLQGIYVNDIADMSGSIQELLQQTNALLAKLNSAIDTAFGVKSQKDFARILYNTRNASDQLRKNLKQHLGHLQTILINVDTLTSGLKDYWQGNNAAIGETTQNFAQASKQLGGTIARMDSVLQITKTLLADVEQQRGSVGKALRDDELYDKANRTLTQMQALLDDMKKNPSKYLQIAVFHLF